MYEKGYIDIRSSQGEKRGGGLFYDELTLWNDCGTDQFIVVVGVVKFHFYTRHREILQTTLL